MSWRARKRAGPGVSAEWTVVGWLWRVRAWGNGVSWGLASLPASPPLAVALPHLLPLPLFCPGGLPAQLPHRREANLCVRISSCPSFAPAQHRLLLFSPLRPTWWPYCPPRLPWGPEHRTGVPGRGHSGPLPWRSPTPCCEVRGLPDRGRSTLPPDAGRQAWSPPPFMLCGL